MQLLCLPAWAQVRQMIHAGVIACGLLLAAYAGNPYTLPSLMAFTNGNRLTVGTDFPYAPEAASASAIKGLEQYFAQDPYTMWKINRGTAQTLWPDSQTCT